MVKKRLKEKYYLKFCSLFTKGIMNGNRLYRCGCGSVIQDKGGNIAVHNKTQKHNDYLKIGLPVRRRRNSKKILVDTEKLSAVQLTKNLILEYDI